MTSSCSTELKSSSPFVHSFLNPSFLLSSSPAPAPLPHTTPCPVAMTVCLTDCNDTFLVWLRYAACCRDNKRLTSPAVSLLFFLLLLWREKKGIWMKRFTSSKILNDITHGLESNTMVQWPKPLAECCFTLD